MTTNKTPPINSSADNLLHQNAPFNSIDEWLAFDRDHIWHPYTSLTHPLPTQLVDKAEGVWITLADGTQLIDGMASWWSVLHGYNHPRMNAALAEQIQHMSHVMFGGLTHRPAIELCEKLVSLTPAGLNKVFLSDSGSVSVEVAMKMTMQYWQARGRSNKKRFIALNNGYHGDTFAAMSVCDPITGMHHLFSHALQENLFCPAPTCDFTAPCNDADIAPMQQLLEQHHHEVGAVIVEPIVQGAGGMRFYSPEYLQRLRDLCDRYQVLLIADEIATGFGRTGKLFACEHANISPDIICLGKTLTGGYLTLAATLCTDNIANTICNGEAGVFMHGPTFMANPLACTAANTSIDLLLENNWQKTIQCIEAQLQRELSVAAGLECVANVRVLGAIGVLELHHAVDMEKFQQQCLQQNIWVRPFGKLVYIMPPYSITEEELSQLTSGLIAVVKHHF